MAFPAPPPSLIQFFSFEPSSISSAPRVEEAFNTERIIRAENVLKFAAPIRVKMRTKGRGWTDFLNPITSHAPVLCSQRVVDTILAEKLKGIRFVPVTLEHERKSTVLSPPWSYHWIIPTGEVLPYHLKAYRRSGESFSYWFTAETIEDPRLDQWLRDGSEIPFRKRIPIAEEWDGSDLIRFSTEECACGGKMNCSRRFVEIAYREKWSNLWVTPFDCIQGYFQDLRDLPWPPELWYPPNEPRD